MGMLSVVMLLLFVTVTITVSISLMDPQQTPGNVENTIRQMDEIKKAIGKYRADTGANPGNLDQLISQVGGVCAPDVNPTSATFRKLRGWCGPYMSLDFSSGDLHKRDGWGSLFSYDGINLRSCGVNKVCGDTDDIVLAL